MKVDSNIIIKESARKLTLLIFLVLGLVLSSNFILQDFYADDNSIEKTGEFDEKESEKETESEEEKELDDDTLEGILNKCRLEKSGFMAFHKSIFLHLDSHSKHIGDTFSPPPDLV